MPHRTQPLLHAVLAMALACALAAPAAAAVDGYDSAESAFRAAFIDSGVAGRAYAQDRECAAALYEMPDGRWHSTPVRAGERDRSLIPNHEVPPEALRIIGAHTHGRPHEALDQGQVWGLGYSQADLRNAWHNFTVTQGRIAGQLLLSSDLRILRLGWSGPAAVAPAAWSAGAVAAAPQGRIEVIGQLAPFEATLADLR
jgi:hypothetical protein